MKNLNFVESVSERDIDFLILEELNVNAEFQSWFTARVYDENLIFLEAEGAWHSVSKSDGESDLVFIFRANDGSKKAILIENKIDAVPQPEQASRYVQRGEKGKEEEYWIEFRTCLIAPNEYLASAQQTQIYQCEISYQEIMAFFAARQAQDSRHRYRAKMMLEGIQKNRRGWQPTISKETTEFVEKYFNLASSPTYRELCMRVPKPRPAGNNWVNFCPPGYPKSMEFAHQLITTGSTLNFYFGNAVERFDELRKKYSDLSNSINGLTVEIAGKSVVIRVPVDAIDPLKQKFEEVQDSVEKTLSIAVKLDLFLRERNF